MATSELHAIARSIVANDRGILAADESTGTIKKRFDAIAVESTEPNRRAYRNLLFTTEGMEEFIGGVILFDETIRQRADDGTPFAELLAGEGRRARDQGRHRRAAAGRRARRDGHRGPRRPAEAPRRVLRAGRAVRQVAGHPVRSATGCPSRYCVRVNAQALARYAALCQEAGIVPIVEPEVLMETDHSIDACYDATARTLQALFAELAVQRRRPRGHAAEAEHGDSRQGERRPGEPRADRRGDARLLPTARARGVPGIVFLSGGQSEVEATVNLDAINRLDGRVWPLSFSYGRALQASALRAWGGLDARTWARPRRCSSTGPAATRRRPAGRYDAGGRGAAGLRPGRPAEACRRRSPLR